MPPSPPFRGTRNNHWGARCVFLLVDLNGPTEFQVKIVSTECVVGDTRNPPCSGKWPKLRYLSR